MGVIFFSTLLAVALGYGVRSKIRKNTERQQTTSLPQPDFFGNGQPAPEEVRFGKESELGEEKELETPEKVKDEPIEREKSVLPNEEPAEGGISLREAIIAQAVLERKCM